MEKWASHALFPRGAVGHFVAHFDPLPRARAQKRGMHAQGTAYKGKPMLSRTGTRGIIAFPCDEFSDVEPLRHECKMKWTTTLSPPAFLILIVAGCSPGEQEQPKSPQQAVPVRAIPSDNDSTPVLIDYLKEPARKSDLVPARQRAAAIDILAKRKPREAIPYLIDCLTDCRGLDGSDNWVGAHAAIALTSITGRPFSVNQDQWRRWWREQDTGK